MADSIPKRAKKCPPSNRNAVRHDAGTLSGIRSESCPPRAGIRTDDHAAYTTLDDSARICFKRSKDHVPPGRSYGWFFRALSTDCDASFASHSADELALLASEAAAAAIFASSIASFSAL